MRTFGAVRRRKSELNVTSLIDVVFMLLIFFMIGSSFDKPAISVTLPTARSGERVERKTVEVVVDAAGTIFWEGNAVDADGLAAAIAPLAAADPELAASLSCDGEAPFKKAAEAMDAIKRAGVVHAAVRHEYPRR